MRPRGIRLMRHYPIDHEPRPPLRLHVMPVEIFTEDTGSFGNKIEIEIYDPSKDVGGNAQSRINLHIGHSLPRAAFNLNASTRGHHIPIEWRGPRLASPCAFVGQIFKRQSCPQSAFPSPIITAAAIIPPRSSLAANRFPQMSFWTPAAAHSPCVRGDTIPSLIPI